jgi:hypothetical protein
MSTTHATGARRGTNRRRSHATAPANEARIAEAFLELVTRRDPEQLVTADELLTRLGLEPHEPVSRKPEFRSS